jgi:hypothetical protein
VLDSVAEHAARICEAHVVDIAIVDNEVFWFAASFGEMGRLSRGASVPLDRSTVTGRAICDLQSVQIADVQSAWRSAAPLAKNNDLVEDSVISAALNVLKQSEKSDRAAPPRAEVGTRYKGSPSRVGSTAWRF